MVLDSLGPFGCWEEGNTTGVSILLIGSGGVKVNLVSRGKPAVLALFPPGLSALLLKYMFL